MCLFNKKILPFVINCKSRLDCGKRKKYIYIFHFSQNWLNLKFDSGKRRGEREERAEKEMGLCDGSCEDATNERIEE